MTEEQAFAMDDDAAVALNLAILGASAGGVDALTRVLAGLPPAPSFATVVLTHLDPHQDSLLPSILQKHTAMPVQTLVDDETIEPARIYVLPPGKVASLHQGRVRLRDRGGELNRPIDEFMVSAARAVDTRVAGVVLSGTGNDGSGGVRAIRAAGGLVIAQSPDSAAHEGMPVAAIEEHVTDRILEPGAIGEALVGFFSPPKTGNEAEHMREALALLQQHTGLDLGYYKDVNVRRRLHRRAFLQASGDVGTYVQRLREDPDELTNLRDDLLIGVTAFFRDAEFTAALEQYLLPELIARNSETIRVWVPACSTGEEAYSIAMLLHHALHSAGITRKTQIFGSDVNAQAIQRARLGRYSAAAVADVPDYLRARYFTKEEDGWRIAKSVREMCIFAAHNVLTNAPFSNVDLVSIRNFLIYLRKPAKRHAFEVFFYALRRGGYLLLGPSEVADPELFEESHSDVNLYRRRQVARPALRGFTFAEFTPAANSTLHESATSSLESIVDRLALARYAPPGFVVDANGYVVQFRGDTSSFLQPTSGDAALSLAKLVRPELQVDVRAALMEASRSKLPARRERVRFGEQFCTLEIVPIPAGGSERYFLVSMQACQVDSPLPAALADGRAEDLEHYVRVLGDELEQMRSQLKSVVTEYDMTSEELRTANEEILSANEELRSGNEELQETKRDLEAANASLSSLNRELEDRNRQLVSLNDDLSNLIRGIPVPVLMLDRKQRVRHFSPPAGELFGLNEQNIGDRVKLTKAFAPGVLDATLNEALQELKPVEREVQDINGRWFVLWARAYQTSENRIDGAVLAFQDIHQLKLALDAANAARGEAEHANAAKNDFLAIVSHELRAPLNVISNWIQLLRLLHVDEGADPKVGSGLSAIERACKEQARLIDDLLDISRITSGTFVLDLRPTDFAAVTRSAIEGMTPLAAKKRIELSVSGLDSQLVLAGDTRRLQQIVANLLGNAIKFTPEGGHIEVTLGRVDTSAEFVVADTGIGIPADELPHIFDRFTQGDASKTRNYGGLGLGLAIVRSLTEAMGGQVDASSKGRGQGARFTVRLPLAPSPLPATLESDSPEQAPPISLERVRILMVDDEPAGRDAFAMMLRSIGATVDVANNAAEALKLLDDCPFDALIADIAMPGTDGHELIRHVRQHSRAGGRKPIFAIALTGFTSLGERREALAAGYDAHFGKPPALNEIAAKIIAGLRARDAARG